MSLVFSDLGGLDLSSHPPLLLLHHAESVLYSVLSR